MEGTAKQILDFRRCTWPYEEKTENLLFFFLKKKQEKGKRQVSHAIFIIEKKVNKIFMSGVYVDN